MVDPAQTTVGPEIGAGNGLTVIDLVTIQPVLVAVKVISTTPALIPVTTPLVPIEAIAVLLLDQIPPGGVKLNSAIVELTHTCDGPTMSDGNGCTVTIAVVRHVVANVYVITDVPVVIPITVPDNEPIVATDGTELVQRPPDGAPISVCAIPGQTSTEPIMAGSG
jgi:hypothetical protein